MQIDWRKVAVSLNAKAHKELESALRKENADVAQEFRIRGFVMKALADALFDGLEP